MESKKDKILRSIKKMENELRLEELSEHEITEKIAAHKALSLKVGEQIQTILWKISQADFIYSCEDTKQNNYLWKIERSDVVIEKSRIPNRNLNSSAENFSTKLEFLQRTNIKKKEYISVIEKELNSLKKRNDSILQKLMYDLEKLEGEERKLEDILEQFQETF